MDAGLKYWYLSNHPLTSQLNETEIKELFIFSEFFRASEQGHIYLHTQEVDRIYLLIAGRIKIASYKNEHAEIVLEILKEGDLFGELTLTQSKNLNCEFAQALSEAIIVAFKLDDFERALKKNPNLNFAFSKIIADKLKIINTKYCNLAFKNVKERVVEFFILHAKYEGKWVGETVEINTFCTHQDIANFTGSKRPTVTTIINNLVREKKIIYEGRSKVIIPDIKKLAS